MANDPLAAATIDRIRALRSTVERTESVAACGPAPRPIESPVITATITPAFGTYRTHITSDDLARFGGDPAIGGTITLAFEPDSWSLTWAADSPGGPATCTGSWAVEDGVMRVIATAGDCGQYELQARLDPGGRRPRCAGRRIGAAHEHRKRTGALRVAPVHPHRLNPGQPPRRPAPRRARGVRLRCSGSEHAVPPSRSAQCQPLLPVDPRVQPRLLRVRDPTACGAGPRHSDRPWALPWANR